MRLYAQGNVLIISDQSVTQVYWTVSEDGEYIGIYNGHSNQLIGGRGPASNFTNEDDVPYASIEAIVEVLNDFTIPEGGIPDEVSEDMIDWANSDFSEWEGNPRDLFRNVINGGIYNDSTDNPKAFTFVMKRTFRAKDFGLGTNVGSFSNIKTLILGSGGRQRGIFDFTAEPSKLQSAVYSEELLIFNSIRVEFHTADRVDLTNIYLKDGEQLKKQDTVEKWGLNPEIDAGITEDLWPLGDLLIFTQIPQPYFISSSSALDVNKVIDVELIFVNDDGRKQRDYQKVTLNGQTKVQIPARTTVIACNRAYIDDVQELAGDVYIYEDDTVTGGIPDDLSSVRAVVPFESGQTQQAVYAVPEILEDGRLVIWMDLYKWNAQAIRNRTMSAIASLIVQENGKAKRVRRDDGMGENVKSGYNYGENTPLQIAPGSDVWIRITENTTNSVAVAGGFSGRLVTVGS